MKSLFNAVLAARAAGLAGRFQPHLPTTGCVLDVGCGTGHNAQALRQYTDLTIIEADVTDMHVVGPGPVQFADAQLPFADGSFDCALLCFVLQYPSQPGQLLAEAKRVARRLLVLHSTYSGPGELALRGNEFAWGPVAFYAARLMRFVNCRFTLHPRHFFTRPALTRLFQSSGLAIRAIHSQPWPIGLVSHDLFLLEPL